MARRNKQKEAELLVKVEQAERELRDTRHGNDALCKAIAEATAILKDVAVHGGRAQKRWAEQIGPLPVSWADLSEEHQRRYTDFIDIAACQLTAANINTAAFLTTRGADLSVIADNTMHDLKQAKATVDALV